MATKKKAVAEVVEESVAREEARAAEAEKAKKDGYDPWERVEVFIPRGEKGGDPNFYVSVNDYRALLPRGQTSMVPRFVKDEIDRSRAAENAFWNYSESREIKPDNKALM